MVDSHDWHLFDEQRGYEVRQVGADQYEARRVDPVTDEIVKLTAAEFEQWREVGSNPKGLD